MLLQALGFKGRCTLTTSQSISISSRKEDGSKTGASSETSESGGNLWDRVIAGEEISIQDLMGITSLSAQMESEHDATSSCDSERRGRDLGGSLSELGAGDYHRSEDAAGCAGGGVSSDCLDCQPFFSSVNRRRNMSQNVGQALLAMLENDVLTTFGPPILEFLQQVKQSPDPINQAGQFAKLTGGLIAALPKAEIVLAQQISGILITRLNSLLAKAQAQANLDAAKPVPAATSAPTNVA